MEFGNLELWISNPHLARSVPPMNCPATRLRTTPRLRTDSRCRTRRLRSGMRIRPRLEWMEHRTLLSTFAVSNTDDSGPGSLRQAILDADTGTGSNTIDFAISGAGVHT